MAKRKNQKEDDNINNESDDTFGLPEIEYEPINRETVREEVRREEVTQEYVTEEPVVEQETVEQQEYTTGYTPSYEDDEEPSSIVPKILLVLAILLLAGGAYYYYGVYKPEHDRELEAKAKQEKEYRDAEAKKRADADAEARRLADEQRRADSLANAKPAVGLIEALSDRTGQYYIVVASAIDDDLIMDYAQKLSKKGVNSKIIPPFRKTKFSRLAVDSKDNYADAQAAADALKGGDYGDAVWVVHY